MNSKTCVLCLCEISEFAEVDIFACKHVFHTKCCIELMKESNPLCPCCRIPVEKVTRVERKTVSFLKTSQAIAKRIRLTNAQKAAAEKTIAAIERRNSYLIIAHRKSKAMTEQIEKCKREEERATKELEIAEREWEEENTVK